MVHPRNPVRRRARLGAAVLLLASAALLGAVPAEAGTTLFCDYSTGLGLPAGSGYACKGPRHSLTMSDTTAYFPTSNGYVCASSANPDGTVNGIYCANGYVAAGPYCGCVLRNGIVMNGQSIGNVNLDGMEYY